MKKLVLLFGLLIVCVSITYASFAWLTDTDTKTVTYTIGDVKYTLTTPDSPSTNVVPGVNLLGTGFTLTNESTVASDVRIKVTVTSDDPNLTIDKFIITEAASVDKTTNSGYYTISNLGAASGSVTLPFTSIALDGTKVGNSFSLKEFTITILFEAKQHDGVAWNELTSTSFDFSTGLSS